MDDPTVDFRQGQWEAIDALVNRRERLLVVERTGWGKSTVYFIATRILRNNGRGPSLIVSPLLALMRNQMDAAERLGIGALSINSTNRELWPELQRAILADEADALLVSPERLANDEFVENVLLPIAGRIGMLVVDEAHCISDWGHDFRPDYRRLVNILQRMPDNMPILGTTATANNRVVEDVRTQLCDIGIQRGALMRESIALQDNAIAFTSGAIGVAGGTHRLSSRYRDHLCAYEARREPDCRLAPESRHFSPSVLQRGEQRRVRGLEFLSRAP